MITLDTSAVFALLSAGDPYHEAAVAALTADPGPAVMPAATLGEIGYLIERRLPAVVLEAFLRDLEQGLYLVDCGDRDFLRVRELVARYADFPLGLVDAAVVACAERRGGRVLTTDFRHFGAVAREGRIALAIPPKG